MLVSWMPSPARATVEGCRAYDAPNHRLDVSDAAETAGSSLRVFAMQYEQSPSYVRTYDTFSRKMDCLIREYVLPHKGPGVNLVVFNEDTGLATLATGSRGAVARDIAASPLRGNPTIDAKAGVPYAAAAALGSVGAAYARSLAAYRTRFPTEDPRRAILTAATDTFVRGFATTFSRLARTYGLYVVAANNMANFQESTSPADIAAFSDPDLAAKYVTKQLKSVWVATSADVWNEAFLWGPGDAKSLGISQEQLVWLDRQLGVRPGTTFPRTTASGAYDPRSNLLAVNRKVPLTSIEQQFLALSNGDVSHANTGPFEIPALGSAYRFGFAISLPAFEYGGLPFGSPSPANPCAADGSTWMFCLDARGVNVVLQTEANPGPWETPADGIGTQAVSWGASTLRAVMDPAVHFSYLVCPMMTGNLLDLPFDGQTSIMQRGRIGPGRHYAGATVPLQSDGDLFARYAGDHPEFLALAPWVLNDTSTDARTETIRRAQLRARSEAMLAGSGTPYENAYLETAVYADMPM
jgi:hypothetical protein